MTALRFVRLRNTNETILDHFDCLVDRNFDFVRMAKERNVSTHIENKAVAPGRCRRVHEWKDTLLTSRTQKGHVGDDTLATRHVYGRNTH